MTDSEDPNTNADSPLQRFFKNGTWTVITQIAAWILGLIGTFLLPPPIDPTQQPQAIENVARYGTTVLVGVVIVFASLKGKRRHTRYWLIPVPIALLLSLAGYFLYTNYMAQWACQYTRGNYPRLVIVGKTETSAAVRARQDPRCKDTSNCNDILYCFGGNEFKVWDKSEIQNRRLILTAIYFSELPFILIAVLFTIQAIHCVNQEDEDALKQQAVEQDRPRFAGKWTGSDLNSELILDLQFVGDAVKGNMELYLIDQSSVPPLRSHVATRVLTDSSFSGESLVFKLQDKQTVSRCQMNLTSQKDEASLDITNDTTTQHWHLYRLT